MKLSRRDFVKLSGIFVGSVSLSSDLGWALPQAAAPQPRQAKRIVILGAGLAGLAAGWELKNAGHDVIILEAQTHPGGRVHTIREGLSDDLHAEAGAGRIPNTHSITLEWVKHFGLELEPFFPHDGSEVTLLRGNRIKTPVGKTIDTSQLPLKLNDEERRIGAANFDEHYFGDLMRKLGDAVRDKWPPDVAPLADISMAEYLRRRGASEDAIHYMLFGFEDDAALDFIRDAYSHHTESLAKIKGGNDRLPRAFAANLSGAIRYGCAVEQIERSDTGVKIACRHAGMLDHIEADAVICTIPFGALRHMSVAPEWSPAKRKVIHSLVYGPVVRTTFQVRRRYWEREGLNGFGIAPEKAAEIWHPTYGKPGSRGLLQAYVYEQAAHRLDVMDEAHRTEQAIADMDEVHPGLRPELETVITKSWANDPYERGAYVVYHAGQQAWFADICRPEGRVWFAGEHASPWPGWMQGAIASGIKAARDVNAALNTTAIGKT